MQHLKRFFGIWLAVCMFVGCVGCKPFEEARTKDAFVETKDTSAKSQIVVAEAESDVMEVSRTELPAYYDLREERGLNPADDQGELGTCWAFASTALLAMSTEVEKGLCFSVDHMTMNNGFCISPSDGGDYNMAIAYLSAWRGPVYEYEDPYGDGVSDASLNAVKHLQEAQILNTKDLNTIKWMVMTYGGVESPVYMSISHESDESVDYASENNAYMYSGDLSANHDVVIVGWDDNFPKEYFRQMPEADGAFICRNSWGTEFGEEGYFYVSYEDAVIGTQAVAYTRIENPDNYSRIYQSDMLGWVGTLGYGEDTAWFSNVYTGEADEDVEAVSFYAVDAVSDYEVYVVTAFEDTESLSGQRIKAAEGHLEYAGYYTVTLTEPLPVKTGEKFAVIVCITTKDCERPIAVEYPASELTTEAVLDDGEGYVSYDGITWSSAEQEYECNVCLKAFTD